MTISHKPRKQLERLSRDGKQIMEAGNAVGKEKREGRMLPASAYCCQNCKKPATCYHHPSYLPQNLLCVVALCAKCHMRHHKSGLELPPLGTVPTAVGIIRIAIAGL